MVTLYQFSLVYLFTWRKLKNFLKEFFCLKVVCKSFKCFMFSNITKKYWYVNCVLKILLHYTVLTNEL